MLLGEKRGNAKGLKYWEAQWKSVKNAMSTLPELFEKMEGLAEEYSQKEMHNVVALGTGPNLGTAQEGALKICEFAWVFGACEELEDFAHGRSGRRTGKSRCSCLPLMKTFRKRCWIFWRAVRSPARLP